MASVKSADYEDIIKSDQLLSDTIKSVEDRNQQLNAKLSSLKIVQRVFKHSLSMQCRFCHSFYPAEIFIEHFKTCTEDSSTQRSHFFQIPLEILIKDAHLVEENDSRTYTEYLISVNFNSRQWIVNQKYKTFCSLHESLVN